MQHQSRVDAASEQNMEEDVRAESAEPVYKLPPIPPPWSSHFSDHYGICVYCVHFVFLGIEICGTTNDLIVTGLRERNSRN
jgi:hypothetical protein